MKYVFAVLSAIFVLLAVDEFRSVDVPPVPVVVDVAPGVVVPGSGVRVLFVYSSDPNFKLGMERGAIPQSPKLTAWLNANQGTFRNWSDDISMANLDESSPWKTLMGVPRKSLASVIVANGSKVVYSGEWPENEDAMVALLETLK